MLNDGRRYGRVRVGALRRFEPFIRQMNQTPRFCHCGGGFECSPHNRSLPVAIVGQTQRSPKWIFDGDEPWDADRCRKIRNVRQRNSCNARTFDLPLYQSNGPAADRSNGHEQHRVHPIFVQMLDNRRCAFFDQDARLERIAHK